MMRLSRIHLFVFFVYLWVYYPVNGISNIFKGFPPLFDLSLSNNDTSVNAVNVTVHQGTWVFLWLPCSSLCSNLSYLIDKMQKRFAFHLYCCMAQLTQ